MENEPFFWDLIYPELISLFHSVWSEPIVDFKQRQEVATLFAMRAMRRLLAVDSLFKNGFYWESHPLVRAGYEDWLYLAYLLRDPGDARCVSFKETVHKLDARVYDAFNVLCGQAATDLCFGVPPADVAAFVGLPRSQTKAPTFSGMADDVELRRVHDFAYTYLSGLSHPDGRMEPIFDTSESMCIARIPQRDELEEIRLALWFAWFTSRVMVLASKEFDVDHEPFVEAYLLPLVTAKGLDIETCVLVREYCRS